MEGVNAKFGLPRIVVPTSKSALGVPIVLPPLRFPTSDSRTQVAPFVRGLSDMLSQGNCEIVGWTVDGLSFSIKNKVRFVVNILPIHFATSNYASFQRQLNNYGFHQADLACPRTYSNPHFSRDAPHDMDQIRKISQYPKAIPQKCPGIPGAVISLPTRMTRAAGSMHNTVVIADSFIAFLRTL